MKQSIQGVFDTQGQRLTQAEGLAGPDKGSDPMLYGPTKALSPGTRRLEVYTGIVSDVCPHLNSYRVSLPMGMVSVCTILDHTGGMVQTVPVYAAGDRVLVLKAPDVVEGVILGRLPECSEMGGWAPRDFLVQSDQLRMDAFQKSFLAQDREEFFESPDWSDGTPVHRLGVGEFYVGSAFGPSLFADESLAGLFLNDATGVWAFRDNSLLRVAGLNYQHLTSGSYGEQMNDNGECSGFSGQCMHSHEMLGYSQKPTSEIVETRDDIEKSEVPEFYIEPVEPEARPAFRSMQICGWLGQGIQQRMEAPADTSTPLTYTTPSPEQSGLSSIVQHADGFVGVESAKGISLVKRSVVPSVQQIAPSNDAHTKEGIDFDHKKWEDLSGEPEYSAETTSRLMQSAMGVDDYRTYTLNYKPYLGMLAHEKEWSVSEESDAEVEPSKLESLLSRMKNGPLMQPPEENRYTRTVDGTRQDYYAVEAGLHMLPDGGVVLHDGYGAEIRMSGGQITLSAPGGIWLRSGKDVQVWAGGDLNLKSRKCVDLTATDGSVRLKAEKHLEILGGNSGSGGVVIESKGQGGFDFEPGGENIQVGGVVIRSEGDTALFSKNLYAKAEDGSIMLDANRGMVCSASQHKIDYVSRSSALNFGDFENQKVEKSYVYTGDTAVFPGGLHCNGTAVIQQSLLVDGAIMGGQHISTKQAVNNPMVAPITGRAEFQFDRNIADSRTYIEDTSVETQTSIRTGNVEQTYYVEKKPGNEEVVERASFSFRTDADLGLQDWYVYADRWQLQADGASKWSEKKVETRSKDGHYPYPGKKYIVDTPCFVTQTSSLTEDGVAKDRDVGEYEGARYNEPTVKPLNSYPVL